MTDKTISHLQKQMDSFFSAKENEDTAESLLNLSDQWVAISRNRKAIECLEKCAKILSPISNATLFLARTFLKIAQLYRKLGNNRASGAAFKQALTYYQEVYNSDHLELASMFSIMGSFMEQLMKLQAAENYYSSALKMVIRLGGTDHPQAERLSNQINTIQHKKLLYKK
jgi:tetratricopeptide (TPR) repeat protein